MKKISTRFAILLALAGVAPLLANGGLSILSLQSGTERAVIQGNQDVTRRVGEEIRLYVDSSLKILNSVAATLQQTQLQPWQQRQILTNFFLDFPPFAELTLLDENGRVVVSSKLESPITEIPGSDSAVIGDALMSQFELDDDLLPMAVVAIRLHQDDGGWLLGRLSLEEMWRTVDQIRGIGGYGYALVVAEDGRLIAHGDPDAKSRVARAERVLDHPLMQGLPSGTAAAEDWVADAQYQDARGIWQLGVATHLPALQWTVILEQPRDDAFAIPNAQRTQLLVATTLSLVAMLTVGYFWGRSFINPILRLTRGTKALADGRLHERVIVDSKDELGQLAAGFNNMADRLLELQEDVKKKERQAIFGRVAVGLVHDLSNPLQNVGNTCKMMALSFDDIEYRETFKRTTERELAQIRRMLDDLRNVAKPVPLQKFPLDLNKAVAELAESMQAGAATSGLSLDTALCFGPLYVEGDLYALNRVYGNLLRNAFQATSPQGTVTIRTLREGAHAIVEISDTGSGIPPERLATIFDDFVTTKKRGLGLGLAISKRIVEQLDGTIAVSSVVGRGTTFTMRFPLTKARPEQIAS